MDIIKCCASDYTGSIFVHSDKFGDLKIDYNINTRSVTVRSIIFDSSGKVHTDIAVIFVGSYVLPKDIDIHNANEKIIAYTEKVLRERSVFNYSTTKSARS
jgi:hypothetical protein